MKKQLIFLYRYLTQSRRWRRYITPQTLLVAFVLAAFLATLAWTAPSPTNEHPAKGQGAGNFYSARNSLSAAAGSIVQATATPAPNSTGKPHILPSPTRTPLPEEFNYNRDQTNGIAIASSILVIIVIIGIVMFFPRNNKPA